ncbi:hypothetical protein F2Q69_00000383 [Brassica cretica]|uniref:TFIIS N-terminal domain-containing protein n=1 Tax=Brassica cretica TaxID=69181 RepID=A0A8S9NWL0_BRACR|nr:hypothetical protein F2Q69_00000383 [Brassica cretica]
MDLDDFRSVMDNAGVDVWTFIDTAILVASLDYGQELKRRRDNIVERLYATSMANKCRNCDFGGGGGEVARANGSGGHEEEGEGEEVREKSVNGEDDDEDDGYDPFAGLFDDEQKSVLEIKERLEDPDLSEEDLVELLQNLDDMEITFQALQETDIGRHVNKVRKHPSNDVRILAKKLVKKWKETVDEWVKLNPPGDLEPPSLIADEDSPQQRALHNGNRQQVPDFGYSPVPQTTQNGYSGSSSKYSNVAQPERKPRPVAPPQRRESPSPAKPSRPPPSQQPIQREKEHKEIDFDSARKRLQQNYRQAENAKKQRTIQVMDIHEIPKPKKGGFFPRRGGSSQGGGGRHW